MSEFRETVQYCEYQVEVCKAVVDVLSSMLTDSDWKFDYREREQENSYIVAVGIYLRDAKKNLHAAEGSLSGAQWQARVEADSKVTEA